MDTFRLGRNERTWLVRLRDGPILWHMPDAAADKVACSRALGKLKRHGLIERKVQFEYSRPDSPFAKSVTRRNRYGQTEHYRMYREMYALSLTSKGADLLKQKGGA